MVDLIEAYPVLMVHFLGNWLPMDFLFGSLEWLFVWVVLVT